MSLGEGHRMFEVAVARRMLANLAASCNPNADCHSSNANDAAVIAHEPEIAAQAIRSPC